MQQSADIHHSEYLRYYQALVNRAADAVISVDVPHYRIVEWNSTAEWMFEYTLEEALGHKISDLLLAAEDRHFCDEFLEKARQEENFPLPKDQPIESTVHPKFGKAFQVHFTLFRLPQQADQPQRFTLMVQDKTAPQIPHYQLLEQLSQAKTREQIAREIGDSIRGKRNLDDILNLAVQRLGVFTQADRSIIWLYDEKNHKLRPPQHEYLANVSVSSVNAAPLGERPYFETLLSSTEAVYIADVTQYCQEHQVDADLLSIRPLKSLLHIPLCHQDKLYGIIRFHTLQGLHRWDDETIALLQNIADTIAAAIEEAQREAEQTQQAEQAKQALENSYQLLKMVSEAQNYFISREESGTVFEALLDKLLNYTHSQFGFIGEVLKNSDRKPQLEIRSVQHPESSSSHLAESGPIPIPSPLNLNVTELAPWIEQVLETGQSIIVNDPQDNPDRPLPFEFTSLMIVPLYVGNSMIGQIGIANRKKGYSSTWLDELQPYFQACANIIAGILGEMLRQKLTRDLQINQQHLTLYAAKLEQSNKELEQFATIASHDLQAPLRKIHLFSEFLKSSAGSLLPLESYDYIERIQKSVRRMQSLVNDLLLLSRVTRRGHSFRPIDLNLVLQDVMYDLEEYCREVNGVVEIGNTLWIDADEIQMQQVFQNLIDNALKFRKKGTAPYIRIHAEAIDPYICEIRVQDNGIGFDEKYLNRIFSIFERLHGESEYTGTGIGLAIVQKIVERHGGSITAQSRPGEGATFIIRLPIHQSEQNVSQPTPICLDEDIVDMPI